MPYRSLGLLKYYGHWNFGFYEWWFLNWVKTILTCHWYLLQGGTGPQAVQKWHEVMWVLELDKKAQLDLWILAQSGIAGRSEANEILWNLLSVWALKPDYKNLSNKCSQLVKSHRRNIDRPPEFKDRRTREPHPDLNWWTWAHYLEPRDINWSPDSVPRGEYTIRTSPSGAPLPPPECWGPAIQ